MTKLNEELDERTREVMNVDEKYRQLAKKRDKLLTRERINAILDNGSPFLEIGQLAGYKTLNNGKDTVPSANIIAGVGSVNGIHCMIIANNHSHKGGAYFPLTVKKHIRA